MTIWKVFLLVMTMLKTIMIVIIIKTIMTLILKVHQSHFLPTCSTVSSVSPCQSHQCHHGHHHHNISMPILFIESQINHDDHISWGEWENENPDVDPMSTSGVSSLPTDMLPWCKLGVALNISAVLYMVQHTMQCSGGGGGQWKINSGDDVKSCQRGARAPKTPQACFAGQLMPPLSITLPHNTSVGCIWCSSLYLYV